MDARALSSKAVGGRSDKSKDGISTETLDVSGNTARSRGVHVTTMQSGDKYFVSYRGTATSKDGALVEGKGPGYHPIAPPVE